MVWGASPYRDSLEYKDAGHVTKTYLSYGAREVPSSLSYKSRRERYKMTSAEKQAVQRRQVGSVPEKWAVVHQKDETFWWRR